MPQPTRIRRRTCAALLLVATLGVPLLLAPNASGDGVVDKKVEAQRIAARLSSLRQQVEILAEDYDNGQISLARVRSGVAAAQHSVRQANRSIVKRQRDLAQYAVSAYTGGTDSAALDLVLNADGSDLGAREGYASAAIGDKADLIDALRAAESNGESSIAGLQQAQKQAADSQAKLDQERKAAVVAVTEAQQTFDRVQGELKLLVTAEQNRVAAAQRSQAEVAARAASTRSAQPAPPPPPAPAPQAAASQVSPAPPPAPSQPVPSAGPVGQGAAAAIAAARSVLGVRYTWSGASPATGFDCSGLVMWAWAQGGKSLPHSSQAMYGAARKIPLTELQPGDLVFYGSPVHHVALYIGGGQIIHAPHTGSYVQVASMYYWNDIAGAGRV